MQKNPVVRWAWFHEEGIQCSPQHEFHGILRLGFGWRHQCAPANLQSFTLQNLENKLKSRTISYTGVRFWHLDHKRIISTYKVYIILRTGAMTKPQYLKIVKLVSWMYLLLNTIIYFILFYSAQPFRFPVLSVPYVSLIYYLHDCFSECLNLKPLPDIFYHLKYYFCSNKYHLSLSFKTVQPGMFQWISFVPIVAF